MSCSLKYGMTAQIPLRVKFQALELSIHQQSNYLLEQFHENVGYKVTKTNNTSLYTMTIVALRKGKQRRTEGTGKERLCVTKVFIFNKLFSNKQIN
jgi:hypothetical protein